MKHCIAMMWVLLLAVGVTTNAAPTLPPGVTQTASVEGITEYRLDNGLKVLLFPDQSKQTITVNVTYLVGSRHENYGETGMAHLLEHMLFKGSPKHRKIPDELSAHGARPNGSTWYDRTNYFETFAATDDNLKWALDLEADRMVNSFVARKDLDTEMTVVRNEFESGENKPDSILEQRMMATAYLWHNYGNTPIGARADIENAPIKRLQAFYRMYYQPDNAVLLVAGRFDSAKTLQLIKQYFGGIPKPTRILPTLYTVEPTQDGEREVILRRTGDVQLVGAAYHIPSGAHPDMAALDILSAVLGDEPSGRLYKALIETKQASDVSSWLHQLHDPGLAMVFAEVRQGDSLQTARQTLLNTIDAITSQPPTTEEVARARTQLLKQIDLNLNNSGNIGRTLSEWIGMGDWRLYFLHRDRLRAVTVADVQRVAATYFKPSNRTVGVFIPTEKPDRTEIPATPDVAALVKDYQGDTAKVAGEAFDPSPTNIDARTLRSVSKSGIKLALLAKQTRGNTVVANLTLRFGNEPVLRGRNAVADLVGGMLMRGTSKHTRQQITDELDRLQARVNITGYAAGANVSVETTRDKLGDVMTLVAEMLRDSVFPDNEFATLKQERLSSIEQLRSEPQALASIALQKHLNPYNKGDMRYIASVEERIADMNAATLDDVKSFHQQLYGANNGEFSVVGAVDAPAIAAQFDQLFYGWRSQQNYQRVPNVYQAVAAINQTIATPDKANAMYLAGTQLALRDDDPDYPALVLGNYMLGGGFLNSRLAVRVRQKEGLSYGVGSQFNASSLDRVSNFMVYAIYAPQNLSKLEAAINDELKLAITKGFTAEELQAAKSGWLQAQQVSRAQDNELSRKLSSYQYLDRTLAWDAALEKQVAALTPEQVRAALQRQLDVSKLSVVKAGDFRKDDTASK